jgi:hypothetical protein
VLNACHRNCVIVDNRSSRKGDSDKRMIGTADLTLRHGAFRPPISTSIESGELLQADGAAPQERGTSTAGMWDATSRALEHFRPDEYRKRFSPAGYGPACSASELE